MGKRSVLSGYIVSFAMFSNIAVINAITFDVEDWQFWVLMASVMAYGQARQAVGERLDG